MQTQLEGKERWGNTGVLQPNQTGTFLKPARVVPAPRDSHSRDWFSLVNAHDNEGKNIQIIIMLSKHLAAAAGLVTQSACCLLLVHLR